MKEKIIIALDFDNFQEAKDLVVKLKKAIFFKVGLQAYIEFGDKILPLLRSKGKKLFLDLKFKDIPHTVYGAVKSSLRFSPDFLTIHLSGGKEMIKRAVEAAGNHPDLKILGVTVLTSLAEQELAETGIYLSPREAVLKLCELGLKNGLNSFVCSAKEVNLIKKTFGNEVLLVTPGIRPLWAAAGDQKRVFTPRKALESGSDSLVIGRPVAQNKDPEDAFERILGEIS